MVIRMGLSFDLDVPEQKKAYELLSNLSRMKTSFISELVINYMTTSGIGDVSSMPTDVLKSRIKSDLSREKEQRQDFDKNMNLLLELMLKKMSVVQPDIDVSQVKMSVSNMVSNEKNNNSIEVAENVSSKEKTDDSMNSEILQEKLSYDVGNDLDDTMLDDSGDILDDSMLDAALDFIDDWGL